MFLDEAVVSFTSGKGGAGAATFHREKHVPRGGPNGADGGRGGDVILVADRSKRTLYDFRFHREFNAPNGGDASGNKTGRDGGDIEVHVPVGTIVFNDETGEPLIDLATDGMRYVICKGGRGGFGNLHYTSSVRQAPTIAQRGAPPQTIQARLELKLLADVGLIGLPNAGKSTIIAGISAAKPKIADYPFTTIVPNLGVVSYANGSFVVADMPGLIEGAAEGRGLGHQFLKHIERCAVLVHVVDSYPLDETDPVDNFVLIEEELKQYSEAIWKRPRIVAINKVDIYGGSSAAEISQLRTRLEAKLAETFVEVPPILAVSGASGENLEPLVAEMWNRLQIAQSEPVIPLVIPALPRAEDSNWDVEVEDGTYFVVGSRLERLVAMTNLKNEESLRYLHRQLVKIGVIEKLRENGIQEGDTVQIGDFAFDFVDDW
jgi:GTP-binding protein